MYKLTQELHSFTINLLWFLTIEHFLSKGKYYMITNE